LGLWLVLVAAGLGAFDRQRELMVVPEGGLEWRVSRPDGSILEMPLAIRLDKFEIEEYPAKLALVNHQTRQVVDNDKQSPFLSLEPAKTLGRLWDYDIEVLEYLPQAVPIGPDIFTRAIIRPAVQAAKLKAKSRTTGKTYQGWVSTAGGMAAARPLAVGNYWLSMTKPKPKRFLAQVKVFTQEGLELESKIEVNKPLKAGSWLIYQYNYDDQADGQGSWSGFELRKDPWLWLAKIGFLLWALGSMGLLIKGKRL
jgi:hypothetical protein